MGLYVISLRISMCARDTNKCDHGLEELIISWGGKNHRNTEQWQFTSWMAKHPKRFRNKKKVWSCLL
jgi:hypothetical protein